MNPLDRLIDLTFAPWAKRTYRAWAACDAARVGAVLVARFCPPEAVAAYVERCARVERAYAWWKFALVALGGGVPGFMWAFGIALHVQSGWGVLCAQLAWIAVWFTLGGPYMGASLDMQRAKQLVEASLDLAKSSTATQELLNAAALDAGLPDWILGNDDTTKPGA